MNGKPIVRGDRRQVRYSERDAGEVGDGPDQGYSGGADSVPPAPHFPSFRNDVQLRLGTRIRPAKNKAYWALAQ